MKKEIKILPIILVVFILPMALVLLFGETHSQQDSRVNHSEAMAIATQYIEAVLAAPSTSDFPLLDYEAAEISDDLWEVTSYVDAQNAFGVEMRNTWTITMRYKGGDSKYIKNWIVTDLIFAGKKIY